MKLYVVSEAVTPDGVMDSFRPVAACTDSDAADHLIQRLASESGLPEEYFTVDTVPLYSDIVVTRGDIDD